MTPGTRLTHSLKKPGGLSKFEIEVNLKTDKGGPARPVKQVTINGLVRANVHALLRDRALRDKAFNKHGRNCFKILQATYKGPHKIEDHIDIEGWLAERNPDRWSRKNFGAWSGVGAPRMNRLLDNEAVRKPQDFDLVDLMKIAKAFEVPYGFLYYPPRELLEQNAVLEITDFDPPLLVPASQWLAWANGLSVLPGMDAVATNFNSLLVTNTPMPGETFDPGDDGYPGDPDSEESIHVDVLPLADTQTPLDIYETRRITEGITSNSSAVLEAIEGNPFTPTPEATIPIDNAALLEHALNKAKFVSLLMHDVREAFYLLSDEGRLNIAEFDIKNSFNKIQQDLAALALILDKDLQSPGGPLTKSHLINMLELTCMRLENIDLEWTQNNFAKIK